MNTAAGIVRSKLGLGPFYARFHVTHRCNYRCRMCGFHEPAGRTPELAGGDVAIVADRLAELGARHLVITGGEPFLRGDLPEVIGTFARRRFSIRVQTNGGPQVTRSALAACVEAGLQDVSVSVDTLDRPRQDAVCRAHDVVENAVRTLRLARELLPASLSLANIVASSYNFAELPALVDYFYGMGVYTYVTPVMLSSEGSEDTDGYRFRGSDSSFGLEHLPPEVREGVLAALIDRRRRGRGVINSTRFLRDFGRRLASGRCDWRCDRAGLSIEVHPDGAVSFCKEKKPGGNILDAGFVARYKSGEFHRHHLALREACTGCFYGEYREPYYAVRDFSVFGEWTRDWFRTFRHGLRFVGAEGRGLGNRREGTGKDIAAWN